MKHNGAMFVEAMLATLASLNPKPTYLGRGTALHPRGEHDGKDALQRIIVEGHERQHGKVAREARADDEGDRDGRKGQHTKIGTINQGVREKENFEKQKN
jgi:hypothetical protein